MKNFVEVWADTDKEGVGFWGGIAPLMREALDGKGRRVNVTDWIENQVGQPESIYVKEEHFLEFYSRLLECFDEVPLCFDDNAPRCCEKDCDEIACACVGGEHFVCWNCYRNYQG
jgi:hypothetical protein